MSLSTALVNDFLNERFRLKETYLSLHTSSPLSGGLASGELTSPNYRRAQVSWREAANRTLTNAEPISMTGLPLVTVPYLGIYDAQTGGMLLAELSVDPPYRTGTTGSMIYLPPDTLVIELV